MKLASLATNRRDGQLIVVSSDGARYLPAHQVAPTLQAALDNWDDTEPKLRALSTELEDEQVGEPLDCSLLHSPLPRAFEWVDGSAFLNHVRLVRQARNAAIPETLKTDPLVYQGGSGHFLRPTDDIPLKDVNWGLDFEGEVVAILGDTPQGTNKTNAKNHVKLLTLVNDITLRNLIPRELGKNFGFFQSKPASAFAPFAVTPDELGEAWEDGRLHMQLKVSLNDKTVGDVNAGPEMHFSFFDLVEHISTTRSFTAGTLLGSGTVSNEDPARGISCLAERRMLEIIETGAPKTPFLQPGDNVCLEMLNAQGKSVFGRIQQQVVHA
jgi:fumarylacetoacetate (FAA) hydrolase